MSLSVGILAALIGLIEWGTALRIVMRRVGLDGSVEQFLSDAPLSEIIRVMGHTRLGSMALMLASIIMAGVRA